MRIEPKQAFYNEATGAVQPWKDIEVADAVGNALVAEGLVAEIEGGGGGGSIATAEVTFINSRQDTQYNIQFPFHPHDANDGYRGYVSYGDPLTINIPLINGEYFIDISTIYSTDSGYPTLTGEVQLAATGLLITGDGTITMAGQQP